MSCRASSLPGTWVASMHWLILVLIATATVILLCGLFRWASADAKIDAKIAKEDYRYGRHAAHHAGHGVGSSE